MTASGPRNRLPMLPRGRGTLRRPRRSRTVDQDEGAYQVDLIVAVFATLLLLLTISSAKMGSDAKLTGRMRYSADDAPSHPFQLRTFATLYPFQQYFIARNGEVAELDLAAIAIRYHQGDAVDWSGTIDGVDIRVRPWQGEVDSFYLKLILNTPTLPPSLVVRRMSSSDADTLASTLLATTSSLYIFAWPGEVGALAQPLARLRQVGKPVKLDLRQASDMAIEVRRQAASFASDDILRGQ